MANDFEIIETRDATVVSDVEQQIEESLRPTHLGEYIGQKKIKDNLRVFMKAALKRREALDHILLAGPPGTGTRPPGSPQSPPSPSRPKAEGP